MADYRKLFILYPILSKYMLPRKIGEFTQAARNGISSLWGSDQTSLPSGMFLVEYDRRVAPDLVPKIPERIAASRE